MRGINELNISLFIGWIPRFLLKNGFLDFKIVWTNQKTTCGSRRSIQVVWIGIGRFSCVQVGTDQSNSNVFGIDRTD